MISPTDARERLIASARDLIYTHSYSNVGVQAICDHAGVTKGSFYHYFPSKRELTLEVLDEFAAEFEQDLFGQAFADDLPPMARFERFTEYLYGVQKEINTATGYLLGCPFGNLAAELSTQDEAIREKIAHIFTRLQSHFQNTLKEAVVKKEVEQQLDTNATAQAMFAFLEGVILLAKTHNDPELIRQLSPVVTQIRIPSKPIPNGDQAG